MNNLTGHKDIPESERTPLVEWLLRIIGEQQEIIDKLEAHISPLEHQVENLDEQLLVAKKLKGKPKIRPSTLNKTEERFDEIFGKRYKRHYGLNLAMQQFCAHKQELLRVLDAPQLPLHTNAEYG